MRLCCAILAALVAATPACAADRKPNFIFILADDLGYAELGCYGQKKIKTPSLDRMAKEGIRFTQFYSGSPVCAPSRCSLMTGKHGGHAWVRSNLAVKPEGQTPVPKDEVMLTELLKKEGYVTGAMGKWGLGPPDSVADPIKRGFDLFYGYNCQGDAHNHYPTHLWRNDQKEKLEGNTRGLTGKQYSHDLFEREALAFISKNKDKPFFLYLPFTVPHAAIQVPDDSLEEYKGKLGDDPAYDGKKGYLKHPAPRAGYAAMITRMDRTVGRILDLLKKLEIGDTVVMFSSDNGAADDYAGVDTKFFNSVGPLRGRKGSVYEGGLRVPMIAWRPGAIKPAVSDHVGYFPDVLPTLLELCGASERVPKKIDGVSFVATLRGEKQKPHTHLMWEFHGYGGQQAVRVGDWKGVRRDLHKKGKTKLELYDLKKDIGEKTDLAEKNADVVKKLERILDTDRVPSKLFPIKCLDEK